MKTKRKTNRLTKTKANKKHNPKSASKSKAKTKPSSFKYANKDQSGGLKNKLAKGLLKRIDSFVENFVSCFILINSCADKVSSDYLRALYVSSKRNCDKMSKHIERNNQSLNHFIINSPWDWQQVGSRIARLFVRMLPSYWLDDLCLSIDESCIPKKGKSSVGVGHQYCGQLGKGANSQVGVYAGLICRGFHCLINAILYLPEKWCDRKDVDIPAERRQHKTKNELAYEMILAHPGDFKSTIQMGDF